VSGNGANERDRLERLMREQGPAQAPPGLADDVMRRVRAEPRTTARRWLRPLAVPAAAAILVIAAVLGISRIGPAGSSSSESAAGGGGSAAPSRAPQAAAPSTQKSAPGSDNGVAGQSTLSGVPRGELRDALRLAALPNCPAPVRLYALHVPPGLYDSISHRLTHLAAASAPSASRVKVRLFSEDQAVRPRLTCP